LTFLVGGGRFIGKNPKERRTPMSVESIEQVIKLWETGQITPEQTIGKLLLWLRQLHYRLLKLEAKPSGSSHSQ
jgi:hypothetical protein